MLIGCFAGIPQPTLRYGVMYVELIQPLPHPPKYGTGFRVVNMVHYLIGAMIMACDQMWQGLKKW